MRHISKLVGKPAKCPHVLSNCCVISRSSYFCHNEKYSTLICATYPFLVPGTFAILYHAHFWGSAVQSAIILYAGVSVTNTVLPLITACSSHTHAVASIFFVVVVFVSCKAKIIVNGYCGVQNKPICDTFHPALTLLLSTDPGVTCWLPHITMGSILLKFGVSLGRYDLVTLNPFGQKRSYRNAPVKKTLLLSNHVHTNKDVN